MPVAAYAATADRALKRALAYAKLFAGVVQELGCHSFHSAHVKKFPIISSISLLKEYTLQTWFAAIDMSIQHSKPDVKSVLPGPCRSEVVAMMLIFCLIAMLP